MDNEQNKSAKQLGRDRAFWFLQCLFEGAWIGAQLGLIYTYVDTVMRGGHLLVPTLMIPLASFGLGMMRLFLVRPIQDARRWFVFKEESTPRHVDQLKSAYKRTLWVSMFCFGGWGVALAWRALAIAFAFYEVVTQGATERDVGMILLELQRLVPLFLALLMQRIHFRFFLNNNDEA